MERTDEFRQMLQVGSRLRVIFYAPQGTFAADAELASVSPLVVIAKDAVARAAEPTTRALLILNNREQYVKAEAEVKEVKHSAKGFEIVLEDKLWEVVDRRRYPRYTLGIPINLRVIREQDGEQVVQDVPGHTADVSIGGAWVVLDEPVEIGSLVEFSAELPNKEHLRVLALVAHSGETEGFGIEFLDYVGSARYVLHSFLSEAA